MAEIADVPSPLVYHVSLLQTFWDEVLWKFMVLVVNIPSRGIFLQNALIPMRILGCFTEMMPTSHYTESLPLVSIHQHLRLSTTFAHYNNPPTSLILQCPMR